MVPPPRNYAADAHECIMGSGRKARRIQGCGAMIGRSPRPWFPSRFFASPNRWPLRGPRTSSSRRQPTHERRASSSVENPPGREEGRACPCAPRRRRSARRRAAAFVLTRVGGAKDQARDGRNLGPPTSAADRRRWPDPCKGWRFGHRLRGGLRRLDKRPAAATFLRRQGFDGQERASLPRTPDAPPGARHHANFPLDKKDLIQGRVRGVGDLAATSIAGMQVDRRARRHPFPETRMARKSLTFVRVWPVTTRSPIASKAE